MVKKIAERGYVFLVLGLMYLPIIMVIIFSFSNTSRFAFPDGFTLEGYKSLFTDAPNKLWESLGNTVLIAVVSSVAATVIGSVAAIGIYYMKPRSRRIVENINQMPIINSEIVMGVAFMLFFTTFAFPNGYTRLILGHITFCTPYVVLSVMPRLMQMDPNIYEAALDLGASPVKAMFKVVLPYILPAMLSGFAMAFTISLDDFIITQLNKGASTGIDTLSTYLYSSLRNATGLKAYWLPAFSIIIVLVVGFVLLINLRSYKKEGSKKEKINEKSR